MHLLSINLWQRRQLHNVGDSLFNKWCWENGTVRCKKKKKKVRSFFNSIYKNKLKMDLRPKCKIAYYKTSRGKHRQNTLWHKSQQNFFQSVSQNIGNKNKNKQWDLLKLKSFFTAKEAINKTKTIARWLGENVCKWCEWNGISLQKLQTAHAT